MEQFIDCDATSTKLRSGYIAKHPVNETYDNRSLSETEKKHVKQNIKFKFQLPLINKVIVPNDIKNERESSNDSIALNKMILCISSMSFFNILYRFFHEIIPVK